MGTGRIGGVILAALGLFVASCAPVTPVEPVEASSFEGLAVRSHVPDDPVGIVHLFHGTGGSALHAEKVEVVDFTNELVRRGYGYVATSSTDGTAAQWDRSSLSLTENQDLARLARLHDHVVATTSAREDTPIFAAGMSNGAAMATVFAQAFSNSGRPVAAIAAFNGPIPVSVEAAGVLGVPTFFHLSANDSVVDGERITRQHEFMADRGVPTRLVTSPELPLFPRFTRIPTVDADEQTEIMVRLEASGVWDDDGTRVVSLAEATSLLTDLVTNDLPASLRPDRGAIGDQLAIILAEHEFSALHRGAVADFFDAHNPTNAA